MAVVARDHHAFSAYRGIYKLCQMRLGLFRSNLLHRDFPYMQVAAHPLFQYSI